jgi:dTDP-4-dehydrorhamnose reductase
MRVAVTGERGQVAGAFSAHAAPGVKIIALGRPDFDLADRESLVGAFDRLGCDLVIDAAAYTAVDKAAAEAVAAMRVNADEAADVAEAAARQFAARCAGAGPRCRVRTDRT